MPENEKVQLWLAALLLVVAVSAQESSGLDKLGLPPETLLLARIKLHMSEILKRQPNYTCLETVERTERQRGGRSHVQDTLRLEVALVEGKEMFAWPGSKKFEDKEMREMITTGTFGNGNFATHARSVFRSDVATFDARGEAEIQGRKTVRYDFVVPQALSGYTLRVGEREGIVGYHGSFYADPVTLDAVRLEVAADNIPKYLGVDATGDRIDYGRVALGGEEFLLPLESVLSMTVAGLEHRNYVRFTNCRQYTGESALSFAEVIPDAPVQQAVMEVALPKDQRLVLELAERVQLTTHVIGDQVKARVRSELKAGKQVIVPKGAEALGRVTRVTEVGEQVLLGITFTELNWAGAHATLNITFESTSPIAPPPNPRMILSAKPEPGEAFIVMAPRPGRLERGMLFYWRTN